jgi:hypothetical protein
MPSRNLPAGWRRFRLLRQPPARVPPRRHGNYRHGDYSKDRIEGMRMVRACVRLLRTGTGSLALFPVQPCLLGWEAYRRARRLGR